jgi:hypothetical protein
MSRISDLMMRRGEIAANAASQRGQILGDTVKNVGFTFANLAQQIPQMQQQEAEQKVEQAGRALFMRDGAPPTQEEIFGVYGPERGARIMQGLSALKADPQGDFQKTQTILRDTILGLDALTEGQRAEFYPAVRQNLVQRRVIKPEDAPEAYDPQWWASTRQYGQQPAKAAGTREIKTRGADGSESIQIVEDKPGQTFTSAAPQPEPTKPGTLEDYIVRTAAEMKVDPKTLKPAQIESLRRRWESMNDKNDPLLAELRAMRIEEMRRRSNSPDMSPAQFNMANKLADDFTRDSKDYITRGQSYATVLAAGSDPSPAGDLSLIFAYMKMLDPGSVVREGEFATAQNTAGVPDRIRNAYNKAISGERLSPGQRTDFMNQAKSIFSHSQKRQAEVTKTYTARAKRANVPVDLVVMDYGAGIEEEPPKASAPPTAPDAAPAAQPGQAQVGSIVTFQGKRYRVTGIGADGRATLEPVQ